MGEEDMDFGELFIFKWRTSIAKRCEMCDVILGQYQFVDGFQVSGRLTENIYFAFVLTQYS